MPPFPPSANIFEIRKKTNAMTPDGQIVYSYALTVADTGSVGIGTNNPLQRLHVNGNGYFTGRVGIGINSNDPHLKLHVNGNSYFTGTIRTDGDRMIINGFNGADNFWFRTAGSEPGSVFMAFEGEPDGEAKAVSIAPGGIPGMYIKEGRVGIRTMEPSANLTIVPSEKIAFNVVTNSGITNFLIDADGFVEARRLKLTLDNLLGDFVFDNEYNLMPINELAIFVDSLKHLPGIPSAKEAETNGIELGDFSSKLLLKIEELTLYIIELDKQIETLKQENKQQQILILQNKKQ